MAKSKSRGIRDANKSKKRRVKKVPAPAAAAAAPKPKTVKTLATLRNLNDEDGEVDFETLVKEEYMRLHRQYRLMEDARRMIAGKGNSLSKKSHFLDILRAEKEDLVSDLTNAECEKYKNEDKKSIQTILGIMQEFEKCQADIESCNKNIKEMESNVDKITKRLVQQQLKVQALYGRSMTVPQADHRQRILENRLYLVTTQFDTKVTRNKELREEINMMLKLRGMFFERMITMKRQSNRIKRRMGEIVYLATQAYEQRDDWVNKIQVLRDKNEKDSKQHVLEIKEFKRVLHNDSKLHGFMQLKNMERGLMENNAQRAERKNQTKLVEMNAMLAAYEDSFKAITSMAQSRDIEFIVTSYLEHEQQNFGRFKYITDINCEINSLRYTNIAMAKEIEVLYKENKVQEKLRKETLMELFEKCDSANDKLDDAIANWEVTEFQMNEVINIIETIFAVADCSNAPIIRLLGNHNGITPRNARVCMKVIEDRVQQLVLEAAKYEIRKAVEIDKAPLPKKAVFAPAPKATKQAGGPFLPKITVTGRLDGEQEEEEEDKSYYERPMSYTEMRDRILEKIAMAAAPDSNKSSMIPEVVLDSPSPSMESILPNLPKPERTKSKSEQLTVKSELGRKSESRTKSAIPQV